MVYSRRGFVPWCFPFNSSERMVNFLSSIFIHVFIPGGREWRSAINNRLSVSLDTMKEKTTGVNHPWLSIHVKMAADLGDSRHPAAKLPVARSALLHSLSFLVILLASRDRRNNLPAIQRSTRGHVGTM